MINNDVAEILVSAKDITKRCEELGKQLTIDYKETGENLLVVGLLKGSVPFMAELIKNIDLPITIDFMDVSSYDGTESIGDVRIIKDLDESVKDKSVLLVEDIIDTGRTIYEVKKTLYYKGAIDVKVVALLDKKERRTVNENADYIGFNIPNSFVVGFGLDFNQKYRNLPYIGVLKPEFYE